MILIRNSGTYRYDVDDDIIRRQCLGYKVYILYMYIFFFYINIHIVYTYESHEIYIKYITRVSVYFNARV